MRKWAALVVAVTIASCAGGPSEADVVDVIGERGLVPPIEMAADDIERLMGAVSALCEMSSPARLSEARDAWIAAERSWEEAEIATFFGPATMLSTVSRVDYTPISPDGIDELLASATVIDFDYVNERSASTRRGLGAVEYVLFGPDEAASTARSCEFLTATSSVAASAAVELRDAWTMEGSEGQVPFLEEFTTKMDSDDALGDLVAAYVETLKRQTLFELGAALGISSAEPELDALPEGRAGAGAIVYRAQVDSISNTAGAGGETSLIELIRSRSEEVASDIEVNLLESEEILAGIDSTMTEFVTNEPELATDLYDKLADLRTLFESDVTSLLDLTLGFSDSDGDSG